MKLLPIALLYAAACCGQVPPPASTPSAPSNWIGIGAAYGPPVTGWASYAKAISTTQGLYSFSTYDVSLSKTRQLQTSTRTGAGLIVRTLPIGKLKLNLIALGDVGAVIGAATAPASGSTAALAYSGSGGVIGQWGTSKITGCLFVRRVQLSTGLQTVYEAGIGWSW